MNRFSTAIFVLTVAAAAYATTCLDAYRYADMGVHSYIQVYDAYVDSSYQYWADDDFVMSKYEYENGAISKITRNDSGKEVAQQINIFNDDSKLSGTGEEYYYQKSINGDTISVLFKIFEDGKEIVFYEAKYFSSGMTLYEKEYSEKYCEEGSCYSELNVYTYISNDTLYDIVVQSYEDGYLDTTQHEIVILDSQDPLKCSVWSYEDEDREFYEHTKIEVIDDEGGFVVVSTRLHDGYLRKDFLRYVDGKVPENCETTSVKRRFISKPSSNKMFMRDLKGRKQNKRVPYHVIF
ncbi:MULTISPECIES: hypothetical protein [unclassified Fibrobacter]|uniref:hypothetical protein n=1 Tax=unclassified Fibrobacter TaxID=2634177 RepID=UPI00091FE1B6|nr:MULTISPECIES: hypothetical protein [unclassified Fibrobacter]OWV13529.1 hypothetical protein B7992_08210 [Fibrobacter sp. UWH1]SHL06708.1 hypothetical protein SAMN05720764_10757 [Fibrobacter sp. UWH5]